MQMAAMSLEELLTKEGFKGRKLKMLSRASFASDPVGRSSYHQQPPPSSSSIVRRRTERTMSDIPSHNRSASHLAMDETRSWDKGVQKEGNYDERREKKADKQPPEAGKNQFKSDSCIQRHSRSSSSVQYGDGYRDTFSSVNHWENTREETVYYKNRRSIIGGSKGQLKVADEEPPLDEIAVQAMISILCGYIKCFLHDEEFRSSLRHNCFASLNSVQQQQGLLIPADSKTIANLEEAIETVEKAAENSATVKELKRASLQLSVITGLNSKDLRDGFTSGIPNSMLSSCAHLYLSIIYKIQKKMRISAKHLLQVFCDSPYQGRKMLLAEVWDHLFYPHLSHLKIWYDEESNSLTDSPNKTTKLKLLEKAYNEILDSGTHQFASYYKDWLTEGSSVPSIPSIQIPSTIHVHRVLETEEGGFGGFDKHPMVSKRLYDSVFSHSNKQPEVVETHEEIDNNIGSSDSSIIEDKQETEPIEEESSIPEDFICPLTGLVFTEPATLETGQTFERAAIADWLLNQGKRTCPVTGTKLESPSVPLVNFILKRVIDDWKSGFFRQSRSFSILEQLLKSNQSKSVENATSLLTELICFNRRKGMDKFLSELRKEEILNMINVLLQYLLRSPLEQRPIIAVLLLHIDLMVEQDICREKAIDAIRVAMDVSLSNEKVRVNCCKALLMLGGRFSAYGKIMTEGWILRQTGFLENKESSVQSDEEDIAQSDDDDEEEEEASNKKWLRSVSRSIVHYGEKSFLDSILKCLCSRTWDLVRVCLITVAWLSSSLSSCSKTEYQKLSAFSVLILPLKECLENGYCLEIKIIASMCLLNFSKIPECRIVLMRFAKEIAVSLQTIADVTWTAQELHGVLREEEDDGNLQTSPVRLHNLG